MRTTFTPRCPHHRQNRRGPSPADSDEMPLRIRRERPVRDALQEKLAVAFKEKFRPHADRLQRGRRAGGNRGREQWSLGMRKR